MKRVFVKSMSFCFSLFLFLILLQNISCSKRNPTGIAQNHPPTATITQPANGFTAIQWEAISFTGIVSDPEDGILSGSLVWISNIDDTVGTGPVFDNDLLSLGLHTITLWALDSGSLSATTSVSINIVRNTRITRITDQPEASWLDWSPDGQWIAYSVYPHGGVFKKSPNLSTAPITLLESEYFENLRWSPDGSKISFNTSTTNNRLGVFNADGSELKILTSSSNRSHGAAWSPDGQHLAYVLTDVRGRQLRKISVADPSQDTLLAVFNNHDMRVFLDWSWVLNVIVFEYQGSFWTINPDGTDLVQAIPSFTHNISNTFRLSPDGSKIAFGDSPYLWVADFSTGSLTQVTFNSRPDFAPAWSPDGSQIAFLSDRRTGDYDIWLVPFP